MILFVGGGGTGTEGGEEGHFMVGLGLGIIGTLGTHTLLLKFAKSFIYFAKECFGICDQKIMYNSREADMQ